MCLHSSCWKAAGMSLTKSRDLWGFYAGVVCTVFFYGSSWIGSVTPINKYFNVGCMTLYCHCISKIHHSPSLSDTHSATIFDIYSCWRSTVRLRKQNRWVTLWLSLQNWPLHLTILLQKSVNRLSWGVAEFSPPPCHPSPPPTFQCLFDATYSLCICSSRPRSNYFIGSIHLELLLPKCHYMTCTRLLNLGECQINEYRYFRELNLHYYVLWTVIRILYSLMVSWS